MKNLARGTAALLLCACASLAIGKETGEPVTGCVTLANEHQILRSGGHQRILLKDGDTHYRIGLQDTCGSLSITPRIQISTAGQANRLCPTGTVLETNRDSCRVNKVTQIPAEEFDRAARRTRR